MNIAFLYWSLDVECQHCKEDVDLVQYDSNHGDNDIATRIFTNRWADLEGWLVECPHCHNDFFIDRVEY
jgi:glutaredoxin